MSGSHDNGGEFSSAEFSPRERTRLRKLVYDDDIAAGMQRTLLKWAAICGTIATFAVLLKDVIKGWIKYLLNP